jgi:hypothetical protein
MSDFVTRLAERAMGTAPVVQPLIASRFAPEPASRWMEPAPSPDDQDQMPHHEIGEPRPASDAPRLIPDDPASPNEELDTSAPDGSPAELQTPARPESSRFSPTSGQEDRDAAPDKPGSRQRLRDAGESDPSETGVESRQEDQQNLSSPVPRPVVRAPEPGSRPLRSGESAPSERQAAPERSPQSTSRITVADSRILPPEPRFETAHRVEPAPVRRGVDETLRRLVPKGSPFDPFSVEDGPGQAVPRTTTALAERGRVTAEAPAPPSGADGFLKADEDTPGAAPAIVPRIVRHQPDQRREQVPREPRVLAPEPPAPTIRVAIGRIEVRAITPPAPPAQQETPARPGPLLSLDDYLKQRNGGQR